MENKIFNWRNIYPSICNAPLHIINADQLDDNHPAIVFFDYWTSIGYGTLPNKNNFHPEKIPTILKWVMAFRQEILHGEDLYHLFLQGSAAAELSCGSLQGKYLHDFTNEECFQTRRELMRLVLQNEKPGFASLDLKENNSEFYTEVTVGMFSMADKDSGVIFAVPAPVSLEIRASL